MTTIETSIMRKVASKVQVGTAARAIAAAASRSRGSRFTGSSGSPRWCGRSWFSPGVA